MAALTHHMELDLATPVHLDLLHTGVLATALGVTVVTVLLMGF
jgi:hypothetical protein